MFRMIMFILLLALSVSCTKRHPGANNHVMAELAKAISSSNTHSPGYSLLHDSYDRFLVKYIGTDLTPAAHQMAVANLINDAITQLKIKTSATSTEILKATYIRPLALGADLIGFSRPLTPAELIDVLLALNTESDLSYFVPDLPVQLTDFTPNDPQYRHQWDYFEPIGGINVPPAWDVGRGVGITVAVIDTGYVDHRDLNANLVPGYSFTDVERGTDTRDSGPPSSGLWHGTHVAGIVAAIGNNALDISGVAFAAKLQPVRIFYRSSIGKLENLYDAIAWSAGVDVPGVPTNATPAKVINLSVTLPIPCYVMTPIQDAVDAATEKGTVVVAGAGNTNSDALAFSPAGCFNVISVAATTRQGAKASFSNYGTTEYEDDGYPPAVTLSAPGENILSLNNLGHNFPIISPAGDTTASASGTSMAAPHVAGVVAQMQGARAALQKPLLSPASVKSILEKTARPLPIAPEPEKLMGAGIIDAKAAVHAAMAE
ncbi:MAG: S8 family serine peptidase [Pseudomonas sp.]